MKNHISYVVLLTILLLPFVNGNAVEDESMRVTTDKGLLDIELSLSPLPLEPDQETKMHIRFLQKGKDTIQEHIDYRVYVEKDGKEVFRIPPSHTNAGEVTIPYTFTSTGDFVIGVEVEGLHFEPIPKETAIFSVTVIPEFPFGVSIAIIGAISAMVLLTRTKLNVKRI